MEGRLDGVVWRGRQAGRYDSVVRPGLQRLWMKKWKIIGGFSSISGEYGK